MHSISAKIGRFNRLWKHDGDEEDVLSSGEPRRDVGHQAGWSARLSSNCETSNVKYEQAGVEVEVRNRGELAQPEPQS